VPPEYPEDLAQRGLSGVVTVSFRILPDGTVTDVKVVQSTERGFNRAAVRCVRQWLFQPYPETDTSSDHTGQTTITFDVSFEHRPAATARAVL